MIDILKGSALILGFKIFGTIAIFLIHLIISRYYGVQILGIFNLILALMMVGAILSRIGLNVYVIRIIPSLENNKQQIALFLKEVIKIVFIGSVITSTLFYLFSNTINIYIFKSFDASEYLFYLIIIIIPFSLFTTLVEVFRGFHEIKKYAFFKNSSQNLIIMILLLISILFSLNINPIYILYSSTLITTLLLTIFLFKFLKKQSIPLIIKDRYKDKILIYSYPMFLTSSMMFLITYTDIFMISYFISESDVGFYSAALKIASVVTFILASLNGYIAPQISSAYAKGEFSKIKKIYRYSLKIILFVSIPIFLLIILLPNQLMSIFGSNFYQYGNVLLILGIASLINALCGSVGYILNMTDNQAIYMKIISIGLIINIILNYFLIPIYSIIGAAIATLISTAFWNITGLIFLKRKKIV